MSEQKKDIRIGCGCLTDVIALILFAIFCDLLGCDWSHGFSDKVKNFIQPSQSVQQQQEVIR